MADKISIDGTELIIQPHPENYLERIVYIGSSTRSLSGKLITNFVCQKRIFEISGFCREQKEFLESLLGKTVAFHNYDGRDYTTHVSGEIIFTGYPDPQMAYSLKLEEV